MVAFGIADGGKSILRENSESFFQKAFLLQGNRCIRVNS